MDKLIDSAPEIIKAAAQNELGILALLVIVLAVLAYPFFSGASIRVRVGIFVLLLLAFGAAFGVVIVRVDSGSKPIDGSTRDVARVKVPATFGKTWASARDQVPVFVAADGVLADTAAMTFLEQLQANGFRVATARDEGALIVHIAGQVTRLGPAPRGESLYSAMVAMSLSARWAADGSTFFQTSAEGNGVSGSEQNAQRQAFARAAQLLFERFKDQVERTARSAAS